MVQKEKLLKFTCAVLMTAFVLQGCGQTQKSEMQEDNMDSFKGEFVISAEEASKKAEDGTTLFIDARGGKKAILGTVKGAAATDWKELSTCQEGNAGDEGWGLVPEPEELQKRLRRLGIEKDKEIIIIGQPEDGWGEDGRVLWELRQAGCSNVKIVDGGYSALKEAGAAIKLGASKAEESDIEVGELDTSHDIKTEELQQNYDSYKIVDTRTQDEYDGAVLYNEAQGGHLPGAIHISYEELFKDDGKLKGNEELSALFEQKGLSKEDKIVTYCTGGIRSAYVQLVMEMCGYENTYSYGQSFWRWAKVGEVDK